MVSGTLSPQERRDITAQWIGGQLRPSTATASLPVTNPATEAVLCTVPRGTVEDARAAVAAAVEAQRGWGTTSLEERLQFLQRFIELLNKNADELADTVTAEVGAPTRIAHQVQVGLAIGIAASFVDVAAQFPFQYRAANSLVVHEPVGVAACITPWNVPLIITLQKIVPALVAGCAVVHKPSELTPLSAFRIAELAAEAGLPPGVLNVVVGEGDVVGAELARSNDVDLVSLTGSARAGRRVAALAADSLKHVHLELGGKNASVVLDDADIELAVRATVDQMCFNTGQACLQWSRLIVPRARHDEVVELAAEAAANYRVGDPTEWDTDLGPLVSRAALGRVRGHIETAIEQGARLAIGGSEPPEGLHTGYYVRPTVFGGVTSDMRIATEEVFGPVLAVMAHDGDDDAVRLANATPYGLHGVVWAGSDERALAAARSIRTGQVDINGGPFNPLAPFGGVKQSGIGRECGREGFAAYLETKALQLVDPNGPQPGPRLRQDA